MKKRVLSLGLSLMLAASLTACSGGDGGNGGAQPAETKSENADSAGGENVENSGAAASSEGTLKIGGIGPLTGPAAAYGIAVKNAEDALETAKKDYENAVKQVESELSSLKKQAEQQRTISGLNDPQVIILQNLKDKLEYAVITAPCDGIITSVRAEEGLIAEGPLFVIEDLNDLRISSYVGEYDISYVSEGMSATVRCDALDGTEYGGKVITVAPTSDASASNTGVNYKIETEVDGEDGNLRVGMSAKVDIVSERKENVLTVTYDSLTTDENGNDAVYVAEKGDDGIWRARLVRVQIGLETDYEIEVISSELKAGMLVLTDTTLLSDGAVVMVNEEPEAAETDGGETAAE